MPERARILVVDDEPLQRDIIADVLGAAGHEVQLAEGVAAARACLDGSEWDLVLTDWRMPDGGGAKVLVEALRACPQAAVIVMTAYGSIAGAVEAVRQGACDYLSKPFDKDALLLCLDKGLAHRRLAAENRRLRAAVARPQLDDVLLGESPAMQKLKRIVLKAAGAPTNVLILGPSGVGKELVAQCIHRLGLRPGGPFVAVNCAALPAALIESELFGHERGAFTGADRQVRGKFEQAQGGVLLLDEISSMPRELQGKLLRALQERRITRVGGDTEIPVDARILATTNTDLAAAVRAGAFREDLYFRLNVLPITVPPLRERVDDIPMLAFAFLRKLAQQFEGPSRRLTAGAVTALQHAAWPGNVRQLQNVLERLWVTVDGPDIAAADVHTALAEDAPARGSGNGAADVEHDGAAVDFLRTAGLTLGELEERLIREALERTSGQIRGAAELLGVSYKTMQYRIRKHGVCVKDNGRVHQASTNAPTEARDGHV